MTGSNNVIGSGRRLASKWGRLGAAACLTAACVFGVRASADDARPLFDQGAVLAVIEENDLFNSTDRWYTQGAKITYLQADQDVPRWTERLLAHVPTLGFTTGAQRIGFELGQSIFTPDDTHAVPPPRDDRPYAGWLYGGLILQRRGFGAGGFMTLENFELQLGVLGPESFADQMQTWYHHNAPKGWDHQLKDEPAVAMRYGRSWLIPLPDADRRFADLVPHGGLSVGNIDTSFRAGAMLRAGWNLPDDFGVQTIDSLIATEGGLPRSLAGRRWGFYVFAGVEGRAVLYNAFLDGNLFRPSPHVDKETFMGEWRGGLVVQWNHLELAYTHVFQTREFEGQPEGQTFGSVTVKVNF